MVADCPAAVHEEDHQDEGGNLKDVVEVGPDTLEEEEELEGQDDLDDDELQSMLQDDDDSPGAITDTANTDWYLHSYTAAKRSTAVQVCLIHGQVLLAARLQPIHCPSQKRRNGAMTVILHVLLAI